MPTATIHVGDALATLKQLPDQHVQTCVTSPPYWGLRDYGVDGQLGLEETPEAYVQKLVRIFREVRRVLRDDGTLWLNLGDSYYAGGWECSRRNQVGAGSMEPNDRKSGRKAPNLKVKDLCMMPARVAMALQADGWWLRSEIIWCLSGGTVVYAKTQKGELPMMVKDLIRLDPSTVQLWNGKKWTQALGWSESPRGDSPIELELRSGERIGCTPQHKWPTQRGNIRADELQIGDVIKTTSLPEPNQPVIPDYIPDDIGWFVGVYLAEGSKSGATIQIASHQNEKERYDRLCEIADRYGGTCAWHKYDGNKSTINLNGRMLNAIVETYIHGRTAKTKGIKTTCWARSNEFLRALLLGYLQGDGHYDAQNKRWRLGFTRNYRLEQDLRTLCARLGIHLVLKKTVAKSQNGMYKSFWGEIRFVRSGHHNEKDPSEVVRIGRSRARKFYDIGVADEPHLFALASGVLTHNSKGNPMPESVQDRPTSSHEKVYLLSKSKHYFYDADAIREPLACPDAADGSRIFGGKQGPRNAKHGDRTNGRSYDSAPSGRNKRNVWQINTKPFPQAHFAVYPPELVEPCILAGTSKKGQCPECGAPWERVVEKVGEKQVRWAKTNAIAQEEGSSRTHRERTHQAVKETSGWQPTCECDAGSPAPQRVMDPFSGAGTTGVVALAKGRDYVGIELNPEYAEMSRERIAGDAPMFNACTIHS